MTVRESIKRYLYDYQGFDEDEVNRLNDDTDLFLEYGLDSIDYVELIMHLETNFSISIDDTKIEITKNILELETYIKTLIK